MRLRKQAQHAPEAPGAPEPQADATEHGEIADGALTRERQCVEGAHPLRETEESDAAKAGRRREGRRRRGRGEAEDEGLDPEVFSRLSKYRMTADLLARQETRRDESEEEPWRKP